MTEKLVLALEKASLRDQTMSNVVYGLALLQEEWAHLDERVRRAIVRDLADEQVNYHQT